MGTYAKFQFVYRTLSDYVQHIKYVKGQVNCVESEDMFLLTLIKLRRNMPDFGLSFKKFYPSTRVIVDATEIPIDKPSNPIAQQATFSTYKNKNTVKVLV
ncbi:GSCOCG00012703001-RA-CDS, partial [Cotesia congregata]